MCPGTMSLWALTTAIRGFSRSSGV